MSALAAERRRIAELLDEAAETIAAFVSSPIRAVELAAWLIRSAEDVEPEGQTPPQPKTPVPEVLADRPLAPLPKRKPSVGSDLRCPTCGAVYTKAGNLARHITNVHGGAPKSATSAAAVATGPKVDTTAAPPSGRSTSAGVASMCLSGSHSLCAAVTCTCQCHGGPGRSEAAR